MREMCQSQTLQGKPGWGLLLLAAAVLLTAGGLTAGEGGAAEAGGKTLKIGVVRLQEVVEKYNRYVFITARFTEDFKVLYAKQLDELKRITAEQEKQKNAMEDADKLLLDDVAFNKFAGEQAALEEQKIRATVKVHDLEQMKDDLNAAMSLKVMEDITDVVKTKAAEFKFDYVTDYFPVQSANKDLANPARKRLEQAGLMLLENLQNRAPTLYADGALDVTTQVIDLLNLKYETTYAKAGKPDPMLTLPLADVIEELNKQRAQFIKDQQNRVMPSLAAPTGAGYPYGVVNLDSVLSRVLESRKYRIHLEEYNQKLRDAKEEVTQKEALYKFHVQAAERERQIDATMTKILANDQVELVRVQRQYLMTRLTAEAIMAHTYRRVFEEISKQTQVQAQRRGIQMVVATFGADKVDNPMAIERAGKNQGMVAWYREKAPLDLTQTVIDSVSEEYTRWKAQVLARGGKLDEFDLEISVKQLLENFAAEVKKAQEEQKSEDAHRFDAWHTYQKDVLHITPASETPAKGVEATPGAAVAPVVPAAPVPAPAPVAPGTGAK